MGDGNLKVWQRAAKALGRKEDRQELWSALGKVALAEECWEDFRLVRKKSKLAPHMSDSGPSGDIILLVPSSYNGELHDTIGHIFDATC